MQSRSQFGTQPFGINHEKGQVYFTTISQLKSPTRQKRNYTPAPGIVSHPFPDLVLRERDPSETAKIGKSRNKQWSNWTGLVSPEICIVLTTTLGVWYLRFLFLHKLKTIPGSMKRSFWNPRTFPPFRLSKSTFQYIMLIQIQLLQQISPDPAFFHEIEFIPHLFSPPYCSSH